MFSALESPYKSIVYVYCSYFCMCRPTSPSLWALCADSRPLEAVLIFSWRTHCTFYAIKPPSRLNERQREYGKFRIQFGKFCAQKIHVTDALFVNKCNPQSQKWKHFRSDKINNVQVRCFAKFRWTEKFYKNIPLDHIFSHTHTHSLHEFNNTFFHI